MLKSLCFAGALLVALMGWGAPTPDDPFRPDMTWQAGTLTVSFTMLQPDQHIYDAMLVCSLGAPTSKPTSTVDADGSAVYEGVADFTWSADVGQTFTLEYQGCDAMQCYMPQSLTLTIAADGTVQEASASAEPPTAEPPPAQVQERQVAGYLAPEAFIAFLRGEAAAETAAQEPSFLENPQAWVARNGLWLLVAIVFLGGLALNLTPCVLPMMPINLAIIGAGAMGGSRLRGALRGGAYGLGIALAYGLLALIPVLTGAAFGAVQSAWWFNAIIAGVFVALALALFDVFMIDFTRFSGQGGGRQGAVAACVAGAVSAVLAGACVAPVLISVLLLTSSYVAEGIWWAICLPFVLGLGMAAPWPIAGAGLSLLPKPGAWMVWVKKIFGVVVLLFAIHYALVAAKALLPSEGLDGADLPALEAAIAQAQAEGRPVLLDFWGTACKACEEMERDTFPNAEVQRELARFTLIKVRMDLADRAIRPTQERFGIKGLPTYVVIE